MELNGILGEDLRPMTTTTISMMLPIMTPHVLHDDCLKHHHTDDESALPIFSHLFTITPAIGNNMEASSLVRDTLRHRYGWPVKDLPIVRSSGGPPAKSMMLGTSTEEILIQCKDAMTHYTLQISSPLKIEEEKSKEIKYVIKLKAKGCRVKSEVVIFRYKLLDDRDIPYLPIDHEIARRMAFAFAKHSKAAHSTDYPQAQNGILGLWRYVDEETWCDGKRYQTDRNTFELALWIPKEVDRSKITPLHIEVESGRKFLFEYKGSEKYCQQCGEILADRLHPRSCKISGDSYSPGKFSCV